MSVPQRVVDCFLMMDGRDIHNASADYPYVADLSQTIGTNKVLGNYQLRGDVPKMYDNRSARFYASIWISRTLVDYEFRFFRRNLCQPAVLVFS